MKRIISLVIISLIMLTFVFSGCSQPAAQNPDAGSNQASSAAEISAGAYGPVWTEVLNCEISHETNICGFLSEDLGITVGYAGEAHYTNNGAQKWPQARNTSMCLFCLDIVDGKTAWAGGNGNDIRMSGDGGMSWVRREDAELGSAKHSNIDFVDNKIGWVANLSRLAATQDGGMTWTELALPEGAESIAAISLRSPECGYLLSHSGFLFTTVDGGATWSGKDVKLCDYNITDTKGNVGLNKKDIAMADICFTDENNGTVVFTGIVQGQGMVTICLVTTDGGETWESISMPDIGFPPSKIFLSGDGQYLTIGSSKNQTAVLKRQE